MHKTLKELMFNGVFPYVEIGIEYYAKVLGSLRKNLILQGFGPVEAQEVVLFLLNPLKRKK